ncbi:MAG: ROK family protein [bacterium]
MFILGIDVGATTIKSGLVDKDGKVKNFKKIKNQFANGEDFLIKQIADVIAVSKEKYKFEKVGIGFAGSVNYKRGIITSTANMAGLKELYLKKELQKKCDIKISIDNDAHCFALAESTYGIGKNYKDILCITLGTGIGGGIIINKKLYRGADNKAGSIGHVVIDPTSDMPCGCGGLGHWESMASGKALSNYYKITTGQEVEGEIIAEMAERGEKIAQKTIIQVGYNFALGVANLLKILNPEIVIVGGSLIKIDLLWNTCLNNIPHILLGKSIANTRIVRSKLGEVAGVIGAALLF